MSGVRAFLNRTNPSDDNDESVHAEGAQERRQGLMKNLGINRPLSLNNATAEGISDKAKGVPFSRQAVAAQSRVSTPVFDPRRAVSGQQNATQRPQPPQPAFSSANVTHHSQHAFHDPSHASPKSATIFGTDTERFDETYSASDFTNPEDLARNFDNIRGNRPLRGEVPNSFGAAPPTQGSQNYFATGRTATPSECSKMDAGSDQDGDDEVDDQSEYDNRMLDRPTSMESAVPASRKRKATKPMPYHAQDEQIFVNPPDALHRAEPSGKMVSSVHRPLNRHRAHSNGARSTVSDENESEMEDGRSIRSSRSANYSMVIRDRNRELAQPFRQSQGPPRDTGDAKQQYTPGFDLEKPINNHPPPGPHSNGLGSAGPMLQENFGPPIFLQQSNTTEANGMQRDDGGPAGLIQQSKPDKRTAEISLDYDPETLEKMTFQQLCEESFDSAPQPPKPENPALADDSTLNEKLFHLHSLEGPREQIDLQRQSFFSSLPIDRYEECGDLMTEHFGEVLKRFKQARQRKRAIAREFEQEVAMRQGLVERRRVAVAEDMERLKRAGQDVVRGGK